MSEFTVTPALTTAQLQAAVGLADSGAGNSYVVMYNAAATTLVTIRLTKPCGVVTNAVLQLQQADPAGDFIAESGIVDRAEWFSGNGTLIASGTVTDESGDGPFILGGADGTQVYAGGRAILGVTEIT